MSDADIKVKGLQELEFFLLQLPAKMEANVLRAALKAGAVPVADQVKKNVPVDTGELRDGVKITTSSKHGTVIAHIKTTGPHAFVAYWLEFTGAAAHIIKAKRAKFLFFNGKFIEKVEHPGFAPKPFLRPALVARANDAITATANFIKGRLSTKYGLDASGVDVEVGDQ